MKALGFTGTQIGMIPEQKEMLAKFLRQGDWEVLHHGDCVGADADAHAIALENNLMVTVHPPLDPKLRAFCTAGARVGILVARDYLVRNHAIVDACEELVATPKRTREELRSGTWATVRYAVKAGKSVTLIWPDGAVTD